MTGEDGAYAFNSLMPGTYQVRQVLLPGYVQTTLDPADIDLAMGQALGGVDFGVVYSADLGVTMTADVNDRTIIYTFVVTNNGPAEALDAALINLRPHGVCLHLGHHDPGRVPGRQHGDVPVRHAGRGRERHGDDPGQPDGQEQPDRERGHGDREHVRYQPG